MKECFDGKAMYCSNCKTFQETTIVEKEQTFCVKGRNITLTAPVRVCCNCGEEVLDAELDDETLKMFYREFRLLTDKSKFER